MNNTLEVVKFFVGTVSLVGKLFKTTERSKDFLVFWVGIFVIGT